MDADTPPIVWRLHLRSSREAVFRTISTTEGRARFWAASAQETGECIRFSFSNGQQLESRILECSPPARFRLTYFGGSELTFDLEPDEAGGTDVTLTEVGVPADEYDQNLPGWVSVLLMLKAAVDFGVDLRNRHPSRTWEARYVDV